MGLLDSLKKNDTLLTGLLAYGTTGQGYNPAAAGVEAMNSAAAAKAKAAKEAREQAAKQAMQQAVTGAFASGSVDPALLAQYSASGGEGSKEMLDLYKFGRTPQSVAPGQMMIDPTTGKMSMPAPKMGEGQMWDGGQVTEARGYGDVMNQGIDRGLKKYKSEKGIDYNYGVDMLENQVMADRDREKDKGAIGYHYSSQGMKDAAGLAPQEYYDPTTGQMMIGNKLAVTQGGYQASKPESEKIAEAEKARAQAARQSDYLDKGGMASKQLGKLNQLENLIDSGLRTGATQPAYDAVGGFLAEAGIDVKGLSANQQAEKMLLQIAQDIPLPAGPASNIDVMQRLAQLPKMTDTPEAFAGAVKTMRSLAELNKKAAAYININGLTPEIEAEINDMYSEWGKGK